MGGEPFARRDISRRDITRLLAAGTALAGLAACAPESPSPESLASPSPVGVESAASGAPVPAGEPGAAAAPGPATAPAPATEVSASPEPPVPSSGLQHFSGLKNQHSLTDPASPWVVVNKHRPLAPLEYAPADLVQPNVRLTVSGEAALLNRTTAAAAEQMFAAAARDGVVLALASGYRSFTTQATTYGGYVSSRGQASADTASARPGYSEHQTGWAFDISDGGGACSFQPCFAEQPAAVWAKANAAKFGFVIRYPWMFHEITGYYYEPWHLRYIGPEASTDMAAKGIPTLEEYFGYEAAPSYR